MCTDNYQIDKSFPLTRPMDLSPQKLADQLKKLESPMAVNTIKNRLKYANLDFHVEEGSGMNLYNYECLPIIIAYLKSYETATDKASMSAFLTALDEELRRSPEQTFCRKYLYGDPIFRTHILQHHLQNPVEQRLKCIRELSDQLSVTPVSQEAHPFDANQFDSILNALDHVIIQLSQAVQNIPLSTTAHDKMSNSDESETISEKNLIQKTVRNWCEDLMRYREDLYTHGGIIQLPCASGSNASEVQASYIKYFNQENFAKIEPYDQSIDETLRRVHEQMASALVLSEEEERKLKENLRNIMQHNMTSYLHAIIQGQPAPDFEVPKSIELRKMLLDLTATWYEHAKYITANLERYVAGLCIIIATYKDTPEFKDEYSNNKTIQQFLAAAESCVQTFWETMGQAAYVPANINRSFLLQVPKHTPLIKEALEYRDTDLTISLHLESVLLEKTLTSIHRIRQALWATAVTLEFFWNTHMEHSILKTMETYKNYITILQEHAK